MDSHNISTFLPPPIDGEASAPLAQPDDDFVVSLSATGTPNTPADDAGTGSTVSPVSPVHLHNRQSHGTMMMDDEQAGMNMSATDDSVGLLPPPDEMEIEEKPVKDTGAVAAKNSNNTNEDDDQVPVLAMSSIMPATGTGGTVESKKNTADTVNGGGGSGNGENKLNEKSRYTTSAGSGTDAEDSGTDNPQTALGCGTTFEYVVLITACSILLLAVTGLTVYWTMAYRGGYDPNWFPWPPQTPKQMLSVGVFTYKQPQNFTNTSGGVDISTITTTVATATEHNMQLNSSSPHFSIEDRRFNFHPTLMTAGFVTLTGFSILVYRMAAGCPTSCRGTYVKLTHGILHFLTVPCVVLGAVASMEYHRMKGLPHLYSLHSWMGILTVSLFVIQFCLGFFTFVVLLCCRGATAACRLRCFAPIHATLGLCTFTLAIATCLTGLQQRADFTIFSNNGDNEPMTSEYIKKKLHLNKEPLVVNVLAVLLVSLLIVVSYTVRRESIKRRPNNKPSYTATVSPLRVKSSSSTGKFGSGKPSSQPPV